ncbi:GerW family sporulation protein [Ruminococcaceae bacterium OttesenSCG-928-I18]|nr:GerW family sporulation protein [Ruminococcaceae bacterium OttesenSCG-928-I18]
MANGTSSEHPINSLMDVTLDKIKQMTDSNTIIGNPIHTADGTTILPVSKVSFGFASGGSDFVSAKAPKDLFGGGSGAGMSIQPVAFLVLKDGNVRLIQLADHSATIDRALNMLPEIMDKVNGLISKNKKDKQEPEKPPADRCDTVRVEVDEVVVVEPE